MQKLNLAALVSGLAALGWYLFRIIPQFGDGEAAEIAWKMPMAVSFGLFLALILVAGIVIAITDKELRGRDRMEDERDRAFERRGDAWAGHVVQVFVALAIILLMLDQPVFWVANALYGGVLIGGAAGLLIRLSGGRGGH